ncbi:hypothetical protein GCM10009807_21020 [Microbacterium lacus]|uniref:Uncharacterized protein n=1 Tax=Microbacterium lacus TaxID=415217 RepID=A0ABN2GU04_9MICO
MGGDARQACRAPGHDDRPDLRTRAGQDQRDVRDVGAHERGYASGFDQVVGHHDDRRTGFHRLIRCAEPFAAGALGAGLREGVEQRLRVRDREPGRDLHPQLRRRGRGDPQSRGDAPEERRGGALRRTERDRHRIQCAVRDAALELRDQTLLPACGLLDHRDGVRTELQCGCGAPQRRVSRVQSEQHGPILQDRTRARRVLHRPLRGMLP